MRRNSDEDENDDPFDGIFGGTAGMVNVADEESDNVTVHEHDDHITVVADVPGVSEGDLDLRCDGRNLVIRAAAETRPFVLQVDLPAYVDDQSMSASFNNGILEVTLDRDTDPANIGFY